VADLPRGVEATRRSDVARSWLFLLNHSDTEQTVAASGYDLVTGAVVDGSVRLAAGATAVIRQE
jgi:beta-galactosidase